MIIRIKNIFIAALLLCVSNRVDIYTPTYASDRSDKKIKNVIFFIGDGMGLYQMNAAETVNKGLTLFNMKSIGLQINSPKGAYTTGLIIGYYLTNDHTPIMLPVFAYVPGSQNFCGIYQNTQIFHKIKSLLGLAPVSYSKEDIKLRFNKNGQFKIAQFTDIHWDNKSPNCDKTAEVIKSVLYAEKPDLAILTGDIVTDAPAKEGWLAIAGVFEEARIPWAIALGNHDAETGVTRNEIFDIIENLPYFIGEKGPELTGCGNYALPVSGSNMEKVSAVLYCLDTNNKPAAHKYGHYDWIHFDQIQWYRQTSDNFTARNNNIPLPALAFIHIPLLEFKMLEGRETTAGNKHEGVASPDINSGAFCSMVEKKDVMGIFAGHDHGNDYIGMEQDIALAFGRVSGVDAYGKPERGSRIILMYEDKFKFDTWIRTPKGTELEYYYPSGLSSVDEETMNYLPAQNIKVKQPGVMYSYYEGKFSSTDELANAKPLRTGILKNISIDSATAKDFMAFKFKTWIKIPETGVYKFYTYSDDGSKLFIDGQLVVDNDGSRSARCKEGKIALEAGFHEMVVLYFENYMDEFLEVGYSSRSIREEVLPDNILFVAE